ncbi:MAG: hypothetical protein GY799_09985 [Desulfobulbaceae bacterium]|nr:hypothetical protein [Desulfobulbaceae bacterium]
MALVFLKHAFCFALFCLLSCCFFFPYYTSFLLPFFSGLLGNNDDKLDRTSDADEGERIFKIISVEDKPLNQDCCYRSKLAFTQLPHLEKEEDLQAHIIKSTGFHTDGFSLGAILYDLISGGKNPEHFYTFCLAAYDRALQLLGSRDVTTTEEVLNILSPQLSTTFKLGVTLIIL